VSTKFTGTPSTLSVMPPRSCRFRPVAVTTMSASNLHVVKVVATQDLRVEVRYLEALDKTPIADIKPALEPLGQR
jgi:tRNA (Thr-GGU) A37 N-methylase